ncbi:uncharacterized protein G2W53_018668 [Senna tora]|uniref:Uncharacterized protein n=1 Tax=Senna tora TaxID=362788 RepID=A0A834U0W6_9FABA|nr:uncharacterized protein G2W53_018668 [Senna tora]
MAALEDLFASSSSSDEDLDVTEPWLVRRHIPEFCSGDLSWLDNSVATHKSSLCRMGHIRAMWEFYFGPYESFLRATSGDAGLSLGLSLAHPCAAESIFDGPAGSFGFYLFPLEHGFILPPFSDFEVAVGVRGGKHFHFQAWPLGRDRLITGLRDSLRSWREEFFFVVPRGGERPPWWFVDGASRFPCGWVVPREARPRPELDEMSRASVEMLNALEGKSYSYDDLVVQMVLWRVYFSSSFFLRRTPRIRTTGGSSSSQPRPPARSPSAHPSSSRRGSEDATDPDFCSGGKRSSDPPRSNVALRSRDPLPDSSDSAGKRKVSLSDDRESTVKVVSEPVWSWGLYRGAEDAKWR